MPNKIFEGRLENGVSFEIQEASGFGGHSEMAIIMSGEPVVVISADTMRTGSIRIRPIVKKSIIEKEHKEPNSSDGKTNKPTLDDVVPGK